MQGEKIVETKICKHCGVSFDITDKDLEFYDKVSPSFPKYPLVPLIKGGARNEQGDFIKYSIPTPTMCPNCRLQQRLSFRHGGKLYNRICDISGKEIISMYSPKIKIKVYEQTEWWSDKWDGLIYGKDFNFEKPFFKQFQELYNVVPHISLINTNAENSYYCNHGINLKNCYLLIGAANDEDCMYGHYCISCNNIIDSDSLTSCEQSYEGISSSDCYNCQYFLNSKNCSNCFMIEDCQSCNYCIGCFGLYQKEYYLFNEYIGKEKYEQFMYDNLNPLAYTTLMKIRKSFAELVLTKPHNSANIINSEKCSGDFIINSKNCQYSFTINNSEECKFISNSPNSIGSYDCSYNGPDGVQYCYQCIASLGYKSFFNWMLWNSNNSMYSTECHNSNYLFGCVGLKNQSYCILNKQYTKEEYEKLVPEIMKHMHKTGEWGEFFPSSISPFGYNETVANEDFSLSKNEAIEKGFNWSDYEAPFPKVAKIIPASKLPDNIALIPDDILNRAIECEVTKKPFKIIAQELEFFRKHNLLIPKRHPDQRHLDRMALRNPRKLYDRKCDKCGIDIKTTYSPDRPEIVYCEECYNKEVY